jgi:D-tyrosyl-tRNA(Tyr) deacylase
MLAVIQRVLNASVTVDGEIIGEIDHGILALVAIQQGDSKKQAEQLVRRIVNYRIFADSEDKMNLSLSNIDGGLLLVPQFTLAADTNKGTRPSFGPAAAPDIATELFDDVLQFARQQHSTVASGKFGADMRVNLCNDGPVTFILKTPTA